jgi:hypothetical protein
MVHDTTDPNSKRTGPGYTIVKQGEPKVMFVVYTEDGYGTGTFVCRCDTHENALKIAQLLDQ